MKPKGRYVLVEVDEVKEKTTGGIILPRQTQAMEERLQDVGTIIDMGPLAFMDDGGPEAWNVEIGQKVLFKRQGGVLVQYPGLSDRLRLLNDEDILMEV